MPVVVYADKIVGLDPLLERLAGHKAVANRILIGILRTTSLFIKKDAQKNLVPHSHTRATLQSLDAIVNDVLMMATIGTHNIAGLFLEKGTKAHPIEARNAQVLMLPVSPTAGSGGTPFGRDYGKTGHYRQTGSVKAGRGGAGAQVTFRRSVHHPGNKPTPFLFPAYQSSLPFTHAQLILAGEEITKYLAGKL